MQVRVMLLHGFLGGPEFLDVLARLHGPISPFSPALYGHTGRLEPKPLPSFEAETDRLACAIEDRFGSAPVHLVGYSLGGRLALSLLVRAPALFCSATLISARRGLDTPAEREHRLLADAHWARCLRTLPLSRFLDAWEKQTIFAPMHRVAPDKLRTLREQRLKHDPEALAQALIGLSLSRMPSYAGDIAHISVPVTLVSGSLDEKFVALGRDLASRLPNGRFVVVNGAGHNVPIERPDAVACAIVEGMNHA